MVNDFGAINVDASLLVSADEDTIQLSNGCVCCTMGADLFLAIGDVLDGDMRPDHIVIEASGIADPAKIANVAVAEPDLVYQGIITVVDGANILDQLVDRFVGDQVRDQIRVADLIYVSKTELNDHLNIKIGAPGAGSTTGVEGGAGTKGYCKITYNGTNYVFVNSGGLVVQ